MEQVLLMHKNNIVAKLNIDTDNTASFQVDTIINPTLLPIGVQNCKFDEIGERITDWNDGRCIPFNRDNYCEFLKEINTNSTTELSVLSNLSRMLENTPTSGAIAVSGGWIAPKTKAEAHCDNNVLFSAFF